MGKAEGMKFILFIFSALVILLPWSAVAQRKQPFVFSTITEQNGLSDDKVQCIVKDKLGFVWIGTSNGLNRYDGSAFKIFKKTSNRNIKLVDNNINDLLVDPGNNVWAATDNGLSMHDPVDNRISGWRIQGAEQDLNLFKHICRLDNRYLWLASYNGLVRFDQATKSFKRFENFYYSKGPARTALNKINRLIDIGQGKLLLACFNGLWIFDTVREEFEPLCFDPTGNRMAVNCAYKEDRSNKVWFIVYGGGLRIIDLITKKITTPEYGVRFTGGYFITEYHDEKNNKFINLDHYSINLHDASVIDMLSPGIAGDLVINTGFHSNDNLLWWGTNKGIMILDTDKPTFTTHILSKGKLSHQGIAVLRNADHIYIGAAGKNFFSEYDSNFNLIKSLTAEKMGLFHPGTALMNIVPENDHEFWLCTENGIGLYNNVTGFTKWFKPNKNDSSQPQQNFFTNLFIDSKGNHWVFPWRGGIWTLDKSTGQFNLKCAGFSIRSNELKKLVVADAVEDVQGNIWFADLDEGVLKYDILKQTFIKVSDLIPSLKSSSSVLEYKKPFVWTVTAGQITCLNTISAEVKQWQIPDEMNSSVAGFCMDERNNCWITTKKGLIFFSPQSGQFKKYTVAEGLHDNELYDEIRHLGNGKLLFAKNNYVTIFTPAEIKTRAGRLIFTELSSQGKQLEWGAKLAEKELVLDHTHNNFVFKWALMNFRNPLQNLYYCKLEGVDIDWKYTGNHGEAAYASLGPGKYILHVKANASNISSPVEDKIIIIIKPPFWRTAWFILFALIILLTMLILVVRYVSTRNLKERLLKLEKEQAIEKERNRIARDMHDDLGSGLTKIAILSEVAKTQLRQPDKAMENLQNISESSRELVDSMQDIIWVLNPKNDTLESLALYIREYALKFFEPFEMDVRFDYPDRLPDVKLSEEQRRNIFLVIKETFNNIANHARCSMVTISLESSKNKMEFVIADNGKGFDTANTRRFGNGLLNMHNRMEQIGGTYSIKSTIGNGAQTVISVFV